MTAFGQVALLVAFVASGYAAFAVVAGRRYAHRAVATSGTVAAGIAAVALAAALLVLASALLRNDLNFEYVVQNSSRLLPWHYRLSALWVGQSGSLLLWSWFLALLSLLCRQRQRQRDEVVADYAFAILMAYVGVLAAVLVFAADPLRPSIATVADGSGFSPLLLHPAMLIHPPVVFLGYAVCAVPFALATAALASGRLDGPWVLSARRWALGAWAVLGVGILIGAWWAYEELGWGGYWNWDPVENGSLLPWLTATALIHCLMAWQYRGTLKKTALALAMATFGLCNFATFVTRSGIFSSLHAFNQSPIGWVFLVLMMLLVLGGIPLVAWRRALLRPRQPLESVWSRESLVAMATVALLLLTAVTLAGTLSIPLSELVAGRKIMLGSQFYNTVLIPTGLLLLAITASAPLTRWGVSPGSQQQRALCLTAASASIAALLGLTLGLRHPLALVAAGVSTLAVTSLVAGLYLDARRHQPTSTWRGLAPALGTGRRQYAGFLIHLGLFSLAIGIAGSSLAAQRREVVMGEGETIQWAGRSIHFARLHKRQLLDRFVAEAELEITDGGSHGYTLRPARHYHLRWREWTTEVAIHSTWAGDFYTILHQSEGEGKVSLSLIENPLMRWLWASGWIAALGAVVGILPGRRPAAPQRGGGANYLPHWRRRRPSAKLVGEGRQ